MSLTTYRTQVAAALIGVTLLSGCSDERVDVDKAFCPLASTPYRTPAQLTAFRERAAPLFAKDIHYTKSDRNRRIVAAALALNGTAKAAALAQKNPKLFSPGDQGMAAAVAELKAACAVPEKKDG